MGLRLIAATLAALALAGCANLGCGGAANNHAGAGACAGHVTFLH